MKTEPEARTVGLDALVGRYPMPGQECTLNRHGDLFMVHEARAFIDAPCVVVKRTKAGLVQVALKSDPRQTYSAPLRNATVTPNASLSRGPEGDFGLKR